MATTDSAGHLRSLAIRLHRLAGSVPEGAQSFHQSRLTLSKRVVDILNNKVRQWLVGKEAANLTQAVERLEALAAALSPLLRESDALLDRARRLLTTIDSTPDAQIRSAGGKRINAIMSRLNQPAAGIESLKDVETAWEEVRALGIQMEIDERILPLIAEAFTLRDRASRLQDPLADTLASDLSLWSQEFLDSAFTPLRSGLEEKVPDYRRRIAVKERLSQRDSPPVPDRPNPDPVPLPPVSPPPTAPAPASVNAALRRIDHALSESRDWAEALYGSIEVVRPLMSEKESLEERPPADQGVLSSLELRAEALQKDLSNKAAAERERLLALLRRQIRLFCEVCGENPELHSHVHAAAKIRVLNPFDHGEFVAEYREASEFFGAIANNEPSRLHKALAARSASLKELLVQSSSSRRTRSLETETIAMGAALPIAPFPLPPASVLLDGLAICEDFEKRIAELSAKNSQEEDRAQKRSELSAARFADLQALAVKAGGPDAAVEQLADRIREAGDLPPACLLDDVHANLDAIESSLSACERHWVSRCHSALTLRVESMNAVRKELRRLDEYLGEELRQRVVQARFELQNVLPDSSKALMALITESDASHERLAGVVTAVSADLVGRVIPELEGKIHSLLARADDLAETDRLYAASLEEERSALPEPKDEESIRTVRRWLDQCTAICITAGREEAFRQDIRQAQLRLQGLNQRHLSFYHPAVYERASLLLEGLGGNAPVLAQARTQLDEIHHLMDAIERDALLRISTEVERDRRMAEERLRKESNPSIVHRVRLLLEEVEEGGHYSSPELSLRRQLSQFSGRPLGSGGGGQR